MEFASTCTMYEEHSQKEHIQQTERERRSEKRKEVGNITETERICR